MPLNIVVTNAGRAAIVNAQNTGTAPITITQIGLSQTAVVPLATDTVLAGEFKRIAGVAGEVVADDTIHLTMTDDSADAYTLRSIGLYLADGTLFAIYGQAGAVLEKTISSIAALSVDVIFADISAAALTFGNANFTNPPATTERQGVIEIATTAEAQAGIDALRALTPAAAKAAILGWLIAQDGAGSGLDADLLDGQDGSYYTNIPSRLGYTPIRQGGGAGQGGNSVFIGWSGSRLKAQVDVTDQGNIVFDVHIADVWRASNDGAGSGLDADLLRGKTIGTSGNAIPLLDGGNSWSGVQAFSAMMKAEQMSFPSTGTIEALIYRDATGSLAISTNRQSPGNERYYSFGADGVFRIGGSGAWHAGNDGAGSGLDADLLDGQDGSYYTNIVARLGYTPANKAGDTFSGPIRRDSGFYMDLSGGKPMLFFADDGGGADRIEFDRATNTFIFNLGGVEVGKFSANGLNVPVGDILIGRTNMAWGYLIRPNVAGYKNLQFAVEGGGSLDSLELNSLSVTIRGNVVWHSGNDGAGSGLDADLLDGQDGSYYSNIVARLGYSPANRAGDTFTGDVVVNGLITANSSGINAGFRILNTTGGRDWRVLQKDGGYFCITDETAGIERLSMNASGSFLFTGNSVWHAGNDGSGSGLDADLLDGADASWFANIPARLGYTPLQQGGGAGQGDNKLYIGWSGSRLKAQVDSVDLGNLVFDGQIADVWRASNDGSGSGLDADLLDGFQADAFLRDIGNSMAEQGYLKMSNGMIFQWGTAAGTYSANLDIQVNFPTSFPNQILHVDGSNGDVQAQGNAVVGINYTTPPNTSRFFFRTNVGGQNRCNWWAVGR